MRLRGGGVRFSSAGKFPNFVITFGRYSPDKVSFYLSAFFCGAVDLHAVNRVGFISFSGSPLLRWYHHPRFNPFFNAQWDLKYCSWHCIQSLVFSYLYFVIIFKLSSILCFVFVNVPKKVSNYILMLTLIILFFRIFQNFYISYF